MKRRLIKVFASLVLVVLAVLTVMPNFSPARAEVATGGDQTYKKIELANITSDDVIIIVAETAKGPYAMSNDKGTTAAPTAVSVTITGDTITTDATNIFWNIANDNGNLTIYPNGTTATWLYCTNSNNGVRVGTNTSKTFTLDDKTGYLKHTGTGRYLGVYNAQDWRCYTNTTGNTANQTFSFYKLVEKAECVHTSTKGVDEISATCTTPGREAGVVCENCGVYTEGGAEIPATGHNYAEKVAAVPATCTTPGTTAVQECTVCYDEIGGEVLPANGHKYVDGKCDVCGAKEPAKYVLVKDSGSLKAGDKIVIVYVNAKGSTAMGAQNDDYRNKVDIAISNDVFAYTEGVCVLTLGGSEGAWTLRADDGYLYYSGSKNYLYTSPEQSGYTWSISFNADGIATIVPENTSRFIQYNTSSPRFACYSNTNGSNVSIFKLNCKHANTEEKAGVPATCTTPGKTAGTWCNDCGTYTSGGETIPALGHTWGDDNVCDACGEHTDTIEQVNGYPDDTNVVVCGTVISVSKNSSGYVSVTIVDEAGDQLLVFRPASTPELYDVIRVTGTKTTYKGTIEINTGATVEILGNVRPFVKSVSLSLNKGVTVKVKYNIPELWLSLNPNAEIVFSNGQEFKALAGENVYSVNLMPCDINDALTAKIRLSDGTDYGTEVDVSVNAYKTKIEAKGYAGLGISEAKYNALKDLLNAALTYSDAADKTLAEELATDFGSVTDTSIKHGSVQVFGSYEGTLGEYATVKIKVETANVDKQTVTVKIGDTVLISGGNLKDYVTGGYIVIDNLYPTHFNDTITIVTNDGTEAVFTFNSYLKAIYKTTADTQLKNLAAATYLYGVAAEAYSTAK